MYFIGQLLYMLKVSIRYLSVSVSDTSFVRVLVLR